MPRYEVTYPVTFDIESDVPLTREELIAEFAELVGEWVDQGITPYAPAVQVVEHVS